MKIVYYNEEFDIDDEIVKSRIRRFKETKRGIMDYLKPYLDDKYGTNIEKYVDRYGKHKLEEELNDYLMVELELSEPV